MVNSLSRFFHMPIAKVNSELDSKAETLLRVLVNVLNKLEIPSGENSVLTNVCMPYPERNSGETFLLLKFGSNPVSSKAYGHYHSFNFSIGPLLL